MQQSMQYKTRAAQLLCKWQKTEPDRVNQLMRFESVHYHNLFAPVSTVLKFVGAVFQRE